MAKGQGGGMGKRLAVLGVAVALVAMAVGVVSPALGAAGDDDKQRTIRVVSIITEQDFLDLGAEGPSLGDQFVFTSKELKDGEEVGHTGVACTLTSVEREEFQCVATTWFRGGQITIQGLIDGATTFTVPITGGSGKYQGAEGEVHVRQVSDTKEIVTYRLTD
jgi:hypothetical protein